MYAPQANDGSGLEKLRETENREQKHIGLQSS